MGRAGRRNEPTVQGAAFGPVPTPLRQSYLLIYFGIISTKRIKRLQYCHGQCRGTPAFPVTFRQTPSGLAFSVIHYSGHSVFLFLFALLFLSFFLSMFSVHRSSELSSSIFPGCLASELESSQQITPVISLIIHQYASGSLQRQLTQHWHLVCTNTARERGSEGAREERGEKRRR